MDLNVRKLRIREPLTYVENLVQARAMQWSRPTLGLVLSQQALNHRNNRCICAAHIPVMNQTVDDDLIRECRHVYTSVGNRGRSELSEVAKPVRVSQVAVPDFFQALGSKRAQGPRTYLGQSASLALARSLGACGIVGGGPDDAGRRIWSVRANR